jgi:DNA invertase Pin-like site-specific DNA recombinase
MIAFLAATAQAQAEATKIAQQAGIELAKEKGDRFRGRKPSYDRESFDLAVSLLELGNGPSAVSKETGLSRQTLIRIRDEPEAASAAMKRWGL